MRARLNSARPKNLSSRRGWPPAAPPIQSLSHSAPGKSRFSLFWFPDSSFVFDSLLVRGDLPDLLCGALTTDDSSIQINTRRAETCRRDGCYCS
ncbi:hypothetical protein pipiens_008272 [Culex pipiens pipiens]|uniref:Uncharacterized protein n=1 Tax=Culex pipiens pipiens TaxID=38569 RepID=A0ABD1DII5_CULPP